MQEICLDEEEEEGERPGLLFLFYRVVVIILPLHHLLRLHCSQASRSVIRENMHHFLGSDEFGWSFDHLGNQVHTS